LAFWASTNAALNVAPSGPFTVPEIVAPFATDAAKINAPTKPANLFSGRMIPLLIARSNMNRLHASADAATALEPAILV
jgi:hypothetical protein